MNRDLDVIRTAVKWLERRQSVALAVVVRTWGSAPRRAGSLLVATEGARFEGSVSGGCVEAAVVDRAMDMQGRPDSDLLSFGVTDEEAWAVGLACGGQVEVYVLSILSGSAEADRLVEVTTACDAGRTPVLLFEMGRPKMDVLYPLESGINDPSGPPTADEDRSDELEGTETGAAALTAVHEDVTVRGAFDGRDRVLRPFNPPVRVVLVGAVHVAQALAPMILLAGFECVLVDPRSTWLTENRFPDIQRVAAWPGEALQSLGPDHRTAVVTLSHDPKLDDPALRAALASEAFYVGALGSRRTHGKRINRLREDGVEGLDRIRAPVGLDLGAREPTEIAVSILAEIVAVLRSGKAGSSA